MTGWGGGDSRPPIPPPSWSDPWLRPLGAAWRGPPRPGLSTVLAEHTGVASGGPFPFPTPQAFPLQSLHCLAAGGAGLRQLRTPGGLCHSEAAGGEPRRPAGPCPRGGDQLCREGGQALHCGSLGSSPGVAASGRGGSRGGGLCPRSLSGRLVEWHMHPRGPVGEGAAGRMPLAVLGQRGQTLGRGVWEGWQVLTADHSCRWPMRRPPRPSGCSFTLTPLTSPKTPASWDWPRTPACTDM